MGQDVLRQVTGDGRQGPGWALKMSSKNQSRCVLRMAPPPACCHSLSRCRRKDSASLPIPPPTPVDKDLVTWACSPFPPTPPRLIQVCTKPLQLQRLHRGDSDTWVPAPRSVALLSPDTVARTVPRPPPNWGWVHLRAPPFGPGSAFFFFLRLRCPWHAGS